MKVVEVTPTLFFLDHAGELLLASALAPKTPGKTKYKKVVEGLWLA
jgi:hypothetical protein